MGVSLTVFVIPLAPICNGSVAQQKMIAARPVLYLMFFEVRG